MCLFDFLLSFYARRQAALDDATESWGIKVERVEMYVPHLLFSTGQILNIWKYRNYTIMYWYNKAVTTCKQSLKP